MNNGLPPPWYIMKKKQVVNITHLHLCVEATLNDKKVYT